MTGSVDEEFVGTRSGWRTRTVGLTLVGAAAVFVVLALSPPLRSPMTALAAVASPILVIAGILRHRPRCLMWSLVALALMLWSVGTVLVQFYGTESGCERLLVGAGQVVAVFVVALSSRAGRRRRGHYLTDRSDVLIIVTACALVLGQIVVSTAHTGADLRLIVPVLDVAVLGALVNFAVSRRNMSSGSWLIICAAGVATVDDLYLAGQGLRYGVPGSMEQLLCVGYFLLFAAAALHPSMVEVFTGDAFALRRRPSAALTGLVPVVAIPFALWALAGTREGDSLPSWVLLLAATVLAAMGLLRAVTTLRASEHLAEHDQLTGLLNRRGLDTTYWLLPPSRRSGLVLVDLDDFKQVNDSYGHEEGDQLLLLVQQRLELALEGRGHLGRPGGDEFLILLPQEETEETTTAILRALEVPFDIKGHVLCIGASVGTTTVRSGDEHLGDLITRADIAMYTAKRAGGRQVVAFEDRLQEDILRQFHLGVEVRQLLNEEPGAGTLEVFYQPLVELSTGAAIGAEALVRWNHPERGLLSPDAFLDAVTDGGLDARLDRLVLRQVAVQVARWQLEDRVILPISVNLTQDSLLDPNLSNHVQDLLTDLELEPSLLHLEVTEHQELAADGPAGHSLHKLKSLGVSAHLDDYGTGYSSLTYLLNLPIDVLKVDRSIVCRLPGDGSALMLGVKCMAEPLGMDVLAEGVETEEQLEHLLAIGVRYGQGYLFSRPLPASDYAARYLPRDGSKVAAVGYRLDGSQPSGAPAGVPAGAKGPPLVGR